MLEAVYIVPKEGVTHFGLVEVDGIEQGPEALGLIFEHVAYEGQQLVGEFLIGVVVIAREMNLETAELEIFGELCYDLLQEVGPLGKCLKMCGAYGQFHFLRYRK